MASHKEWDGDEFFKSGWKNPPKFGGNKKGKDKSDGKPRVFIPKEANEARPKEKKEFIPTSKRTNFTTKQLDTISWLFDDLLESGDIHNVVHLFLEDFHPIAKARIGSFLMKASPIMRLESESEEDTDTDEALCKTFNTSMDPEKFVGFITTCLRMGKKAHSYMPYIIALRGEIVSYDIMLRQKYQQLNDVGGTSSHMPHIKGFFLLDDKHLSNNTSLVASAYKALKIECSKCEVIPGITQSFFGLYHKESKTFLVIKVPC